ncbi:putative AAA domain containing protein [Lyophyllum shimeji]|uniref:AAA domain containing protein n=1 Tax=Lyophyllum shimeji TaxID=47721 RepID=A0A9P3PS11_LYOSH|nr:putative AAA domain containing protein [Lyophyllum shimeji]
MSVTLHNMDICFFPDDLAMRAWISQLLAVYGNGAETLAKVRRIDTAKISVEKLNIIAKIATDSLRLDQLKPIKMAHQAKVVCDGAGRTIVQSSTYKNKLRSEKVVRLGIRGSSETSGYTIPAQVGLVNGKSGLLQAAQSVDGPMVATVISIGRDDPTTAEAQRAATILRILQGYEQLLTNSPWIQNIFFPSGDPHKPLSWPLEWSDPCKSGPSLMVPNPPSILLQLNSSQQDAVNTMYSTLDKHRITVIQGPPGTGKTSVIASFVQLAIQTGLDGIWLVAQSNVAVKNIAEKLLSAGFTAWKLLVSKDFIFEWHEHIYTKVQDNIIRSDQFFKIKPHAIKDCKVMLCTLSMLSNMFITKFTSQNPMKILIVDEASQIEIGDYISILSTSSSNLRKACFIGDDKQLPPFGQEDLQDLQSIFEIPHLHPLRLFLDTQYRMPPQIGAIISNLVYDSKLKSNPTHPITDKVLACRFIDVPGHEQLNGSSFMNLLECEAVIKLAQQLQVQQKAYQIITPYEGQRGIIEARMKDTPDLDWENKCFNVDSFQGNEEDYIIISLVRSFELGFLINLRRTNVMLTRCKKGMFIVSSRKFLKGKGASTLVGALEQRMGPEAWLEIKDLEEGNC